MTVHDLAADWTWMEARGNVGFRLHGGRVVWHEAMYTDRSSKVRISRVVGTVEGARAIVRYVEPETAVELVSET